MSEADIPIGFNRMNRFRQSLPLSRSASQNKLRSPGKDLRRFSQALLQHAGWTQDRFAAFSLLHVAGDVNFCASKEWDDIYCESAT